MKVKQPRLQEVLVISGPRRADWKRVQSDLSLKSLQFLVGGQVELLELSGGLSLWFDEEGGLRSLPPTLWVSLGRPGRLFGGRQLLHGPVVVSGTQRALGRAGQLLQPYLSAQTELRV